MRIRILKVLFPICIVGTVFGQNVGDSINSVQNDSLNADKDIVDVFHFVFDQKKHSHVFVPKADRAHFALVPTIGYSLQTGFAMLVGANAVFYTDKNDHTKISTVLTSIIFTQYDQIILPFQANIWTKGNKYNIISDSRYMNYPSQTFGLGGKSLVTSGYNIDFSYLKIHQSILKNLSNNFYAGLGYYYDYLWDEKEIDPPSNIKTSFQKYGLYNNETASGICLQGLFDNRKNQVNPAKGFYANLRYRTNYKWMGSTRDWKSIVLELKKYIPFPKKSKNVLAFWNYNWITFGGNPPYLLLPSTGWDDFFNTGRGYIQGRYRARNMSYLEAEYRFRILSNGLLGGVIFGNVQTFSKGISNEYRSVIPGYGLGLRIKINKHSSTNLCIDYGFGINGSQGFFVNLGEVF